MKLLPVPPKTANPTDYEKSPICSCARFPFDRFERFIADHVLVSGIEVAVYEPYVTILESVAGPLAQGNVLTTEALFLKLDEFNGIDFSLLPSDNNADGALIISPYSLPHEGLYSSFPLMEFKINSNTGCLGGVITRELSKLVSGSDSCTNKPYAIMMDREKGVTLYAANADQWMSFQVEDIATDFFESAKLIAAINPELVSLLVLSKIRNMVLSPDEIYFYQEQAPGETPEKDKETKNKIAQVIGKIVGSPRVKGIGGAALEYYNSLPELIENSSLKTTLNSRILKEQLKRSSFSAQIFKQIFESMSQWIEDKPQLGETFLSHTIPMLVAVSSLLRADNKPAHLSFGLVKLAQQVGERNVNILSLLCPPYIYTIDKKNNLHHASGRLIPNIGDRFAKVARTLAFIVSTLTRHGVSVNWEFWAYSGESCKTEYLVDIGQFVFDYYSRNTSELFQSLQKAFQDLEAQSRSIFNRYGIQAKAVSIDGKLGKSIADLVDDFIATFPDQIQNITDEKQVEDWLQVIIGSRSLIHFFIEEELKYRRNLAGSIRDYLDNVIPAALREALLYHAIINYVLRNNYVIIDTESSSNYMSGALRHLYAPVIMGRGFDPLQPEKAFTVNIRQPYNSFAVTRGNPMG